MPDDFFFRALARAIIEREPERRRAAVITECAVYCAPFTFTIHRHYVYMRIHSARFVAFSIICGISYRTLELTLRCLPSRASSGYNGSRRSGGDGGSGFYRGIINHLSFDVTSSSSLSPLCLAVRLEFVLDLFRAAFTRPPRFSHRARFTWRQLVFKRTSVKTLQIQLARIT